MLITMMLGMVAAAGGRMEPLPPMPERDRVCPPDVSKLGDVGFDARNGDRFGPSHLGARDTVQVVIHDMNPFLYSYRRVVTSVPTETSLPLAFASALKILPEQVAGQLKAMNATATQQRGGCVEFKTHYERLAAGLAAFRKVAAEPGKGCDALYAATARSIPSAATALIEAWNTNTDRGCSPAAAEDEEKVSTALDAARGILATWGNPARFNDVTVVSIPDEPTTISVQLHRTALEDANAREERVVGASIEVGVSRVSVSIGGAWLSLPSRSVVRQLHKQSDGTTPQNAFAYDENSASHFAPVLLLHGAIVDVPTFLFVPRSQVTATLGAAVPVGEDPPIDWVVGLSWCFARTVYLDVGAEFAQVTRIGGGFKEGDLVPSSMQDPLPTTRSWEVGGTVGLSWRIW